MPFVLSYLFWYFIHYESSLTFSIFFFSDIVFPFVVFFICDDMEECTTPPQKVNILKTYFLSNNIFRTLFQLALHVVPVLTVLLMPLLGRKLSQLGWLVCRMMDFAALLIILMSARKELLLLFLLPFPYWPMPPETGLILSVLMCGDVNKYVHLVTSNIVIIFSFYWRNVMQNQML